jgi:hypothetical protein
MALAFLIEPEERAMATITIDTTWTSTGRPHANILVTPLRRLRALAWLYRRTSAYSAAMRAARAELGDRGMADIGLPREAPTHAFGHFATIFLSDQH